MGNQRKYVEEGQPTKWAEEKVQKGKQLFTKHYTENYKLSNMSPSKN